MQPWVAAYYTPGEVLFLLALRRKDAIECDEAPPDSLARFAQGQNQISGGEGDPELPVLVRRSDVRRAQQIETGLLALRGAGVTTAEIAAANGSSQPTVHRRYRAALADVLAQLGSLDVEDSARARPSACILCGRSPRAKLKPVLRRIRGGWKEVKPARLLNICADCCSGGPEEYRLEGRPDDEEEAT